MMKNTIFIYGAGGFAREVAWLIDSSSETEFEVLGFIDDSATQPGDWPDLRPVMSFEAARKVSVDAGIVIGVGSPTVRRNIAERLSTEHVALPSLVHSSVALSDRVSVGEGCVICSGVQLTVDIKIGAHVHINLNCSVGHDSTIGNFTTLSPGVNVSGNVSIGNDVFVGSGANIINGKVGDPLIVADGTIIAAGASVIGLTKSNTLYAGVPAVAKKSW